MMIMIVSRLIDALAT